MWSFFTKKPVLSEQTLSKISIIAAVFSIVICVLLIANYLQIHKADPINMKVITTLVERLNVNPADSPPFSGRNNKHPRFTFPGTPK